MRSGVAAPPQAMRTRKLYRNKLDRMLDGHRTWSDDLWAEVLAYFDYPTAVPKRLAPAEARAMAKWLGQRPAALAAAKRGAPVAVHDEAERDANLANFRHVPPSMLLRGYQQIRRARRRKPSVAAKGEPFGEELRAALATFAALAPRLEYAKKLAAPGFDLEMTEHLALLAGRYFDVDTGSPLAEQALDELAQLQAQTFMELIGQAVDAEDEEATSVLTSVGQSPEKLRFVLGAWKCLIDLRTGLEWLYGSPEDLATPVRLERAVSVFTDAVVKELERISPGRSPV